MTLEILVVWALVGAFLYWLVQRERRKPKPVVKGYAPITDPERVHNRKRDIPYGLPRSVTTKDGKTYRRMGATTDYIYDGYDRTRRDDSDNFLTWWLLWQLMTDDDRQTVIDGNPDIEAFTANGGDFAGGGASASWEDDRSSSSVAAAVVTTAEPAAPAASDRGWDRAPDEPVRSEPSTSDSGRDYGHSSVRDSDYGSRDYSPPSSNDYGGGSDYGSSSSSSSSGGGYGSD